MGQIAHLRNSSNRLTHLLKTSNIFTEAHLGPIKFWGGIPYNELNLLLRILEFVITNFKIRFNEFQNPF